MKQASLSQAAPAVRMRQRLTRNVALVVMLAFLLVGIITAFAIRNLVRVTLEQDQLDEVRQIETQVEQWWETARDDARFLATNSLTRDFAALTISATRESATSLEETQQQLMQIFNAVLERNRGSYLAIRYVTTNGFVWSEINQYSGTTVQANTRISNQEQADDASFQRGLMTPINDVSNSALLFRKQSGSDLLAYPLSPFIRFVSPVDAVGDMQTVAGQIQIDIAVLPLLNEITSITADESFLTETQRRVLIIDAQGNGLFDNGVVSDEQLRLLSEAFSLSVADDVAPLAGVIASNPAGVRALNTSGWLLTSVPLPITDTAGSVWTLAVADSFSGVFDTGIIFPIAVVLTSLALGGVVSLLLRNLLLGNLRPLETTSALARQVAGQTPVAANVPPPALDDSETGMGEIVQAFAHLQGQVSQLNNQLNTTSERYQRNLDIARRISRETATLRNVDDLINRTIELICTRYGFYHAQVFLTDDVGKQAVLRYSQGEAGQQMLKQGHRLAVGSQSVIGQVTQRAEAVIVNDTMAGGVPHRVNPLLPETRAEMALPLVAGERVIGALDVQSTIADVFRDDELQIFQLLADQLAVAIQNARLMVEAEKRAQQVEQVSRQFTSTTWQDQISRGDVDQSFHYNLMTVTDEIPKVPDYSVPISVRGVVIGEIGASLEGDETLTSGDEIFLRAIADRVGLAIENARLLTETQSSLNETFVLYQLSRALSDANQLEEVLSATISTVLLDANVGFIATFEDADKGGTDWLSIAAAWHADQPLDLTGTRLRVLEHPLLWNIKQDQPVAIESVEQDRRLDERLRELFLTQMGAASAIVLPFTVRGNWRGVVIFGFPVARQFSEQDGRLYTALIDQAGVAIDNRLLLTQNETTLAQIERLYGGSRVVNTAQSMKDVVRAAIVANSDLSIGFELGILEGDLNAHGWSTSFRITARSQGVEVIEADSVFPLELSSNSVLLAREPLRLGAGSRDPGARDFDQWMRRNRFETGVVFPLFSANQPIALFFLISEEPVLISEDDVEVYRALTGQMSTVLQNTRLLEQTERALDETQRLYQASRTIATANSASEVFASAAHYITETGVAATRISALLTGADTSWDAPSLNYAYVWTRSPSYASDLKAGLRVSVDIAPFGRLFNAYGSVLRYNDLRAELPPLKLDSLLALLERSGSRSALIIALRTRQKWLGVLLLESDQVGAFSSALVPFLQAVADQLAIAVDSLQSFAEAQTEARRALALAEASQFANRVGADLGRSLNEVFTRIAEAANYRQWQLLLADEDADYLDEVLAHMPRVETMHQPRLEIARGQHSMLDAFRNKHSVIVNNPLTYPAFAAYEEERRSELGKHIAVPIMLAGERLGVLYLGRYIYEEDMTERDEQLGLTLAAQIAVALENRRLLRTTETERETLRTILDTLPVGVIVLNSRSYRPLQANAQAEMLLGRPIDSDMVFDIEGLNIYRTGTNVLYPQSEFPVFTAIERHSSEFADDISLVRPDGSEIDLLINVAPLKDADGRSDSIVIALQDISNLRGLENTLQENLRETITLYETTRALSEAPDAEDILDLVLMQLALQEPDEIYLLMLDTSGDGVRLARTLNHTTDMFNLPDSLLDPQQSRFVQDTRDPDQVADDVERLALTQQGIGSFIVLPMRTRLRTGVPLGWIVLTFSRRQYFSLEREQAITTLVESTAVALDNRNLFRSTEAALAETASLYGSTTAVSRAQSLDELSRALQRALEWLDPDFYAVYMVHEGSMMPLFNLGMDREPLDLSALIGEHARFRGGSLFVDDVQALNRSPLTPYFDQVPELRSIGVIPMGLQGRSSGYLVVGYYQPRQFRESDSRYMASLADSASVVADNITLLDQIQSNLTETSMLYLASRDLNDATTEHDILNVVVEHLMDRPATQVIVMQLVGKDWRDPQAVLRVAASWHSSNVNALDLSGVSFESTTFPSWSIFSSGDVRLINDVSGDPQLDEVSRFALLSLEIASTSILPLRLGNRPYGVILICNDEPYTHTERDDRVYRSFSRQASLRLEASRLFDQTERRARQLATSARVSQLASSLEELNRLLPTIVELIKDAFGYDHAQIFLMDAQDRFAVLRASTGEAGQQLLSIQHKLEKGSKSVIGRVTATGEPVLALDTAAAGVMHRPNPYLPRTRSEMAVPLILKGEVIGALDVQSNQPNFFTEDDVNVLTTLAAQISVAIDNAQLYEQSQARAKDMYFLFTVATAASSAEKLRDALQNVVVSLQELMDASVVSIYTPVQLTDGEQTIIELRPAALAGSSMPLSELSEVRLDEQKNLLARAAVEQRPYIVEDISREPGYLPIMDNAQSAILVPLTVGTTLVSMVTMESARANAFNDETLTLLLTLSGTLAATVQNQQLLEELQRTNEQLLELDRLKSDFLANMSHELRTPLNSIIGFSRVILKGIDGPLTEMQEQDLSTIYNSGQHLLNLINDILDQAKIAAGKMDLQAEFFDMKAVIDGVRSIGIGLLKDKPIDIIVNIAPGLPKAFGDEFRTRQVLLNLVSNAAKFTREGSITIDAYVTQDEATAASMMRVDVTDTGMGIAEKDLPLLFEAFRQVDSSLTKTHGGTGLGLPIAKSLIEMQGGQMLVASKVNVGSTFSIVVPITPLPEIKNATQEMRAVTPGSTASLDPAKVPAKAPETNGKPANGSNDTAKQPVIPPLPKAAHIRRQVLLIEDNTDMIDQFRRTLQRDGFDVFAASIPLEAEAMASGLHPTLIVLSTSFANDTGWAMLERLQQRDDTFDIPVIVVSLADDGERAAAAGAFRFIRKPFMPEVLSQAAKEAETEAQVQRILIIDDDPHATRLLQQMLDESGKYRVFCAGNGIDGIGLVARRRPDLIILDLRMPEMSGFDVIAELHSNPETANIPIMIVTGETLSQDEMVRLSELRVIYKPDIDSFGAQTFLETVKANLAPQNGDY
ncbi:MAG: GAF domain-containing protein [Chloroflexota bacterium]|nr:GAF domain-containing protein [Chloroflexota bacterium]